MRFFEISAVGSALCYLALTFSQASTGYPQAGAFLLAILIGTLTVGIGAAIAFDVWPDDVATVRAGRLPAHACRGCGRPMVEVHTAWVCGRCDRAPGS